MGTRSNTKNAAKVARGRVRRLEFDGDAAESRTEFRLLYVGFQQGAQAQQSRTVETQMHESEILRKLWAVSTDNATIPEGVFPRTRLLNAGPLAIEFSDQEWTVLLRYYNSDKIPWLMDGISDVVALRNRLQAIELTEPES